MKINSTTSAMSRRDPAEVLESLNTPAAKRDLWLLDPNVTFLNHGSFGSCPKTVLEFQTKLRERLEREPIDFFVRDLETLLDGARAELAAFIGAAADDLVFVPNATAGVNTVLRSFPFEKEDEVVVTNHEYNACRNALDFAARSAGVQVKVVEIPFPVASPEEITGRVIEAISSRTRLVLMDHVTSQTGLVLPIEAIAAGAAERGVDLLVDGAHAPGMIPLQIEKLGAAYYTGNCHKWLCAPKGAGFLYVRRDRQENVRPLSISHGANSPRKDRSRFQIEFGWTGTSDPSAYLSVPLAIRTLGSLAGDGWPGVMRRNRALALAGRAILCQVLEQAEPAPAEMIGALASVPLPPGLPAPPKSPLYMDPLQETLRSQHQIEVPIIPWPSPPQRLLRISAQLYNALPEYQRLAEALQQALSSPAPANS